MIEYTAFDIALVPVIIGLIEIAKQVGLPAKWSPVAAIIIGIIVGCVYVADSPAEGILVGLTMGLAASGLYSGVKNVIKAKE